MIPNDCDIHSTTKTNFSNSNEITEARGRKKKPKGRQLTGGEGSSKNKARSSKMEEEEDIYVKEEIVDVDMKDLLKMDDLNAFSADVEQGLNNVELFEMQTEARDDEFADNFSTTKQRLEGQAISVICSECQKEINIVCDPMRHSSITKTKNFQCKQCFKASKQSRRYAHYLRRITASHEDETDKHGIEDMWKSFRSLEDFDFDKDIDLDEFMAEWHSKVAAALSEGCHYSDRILAFKLLEKMNLDNSDLDTIISTLTYPAEGESLLNQTINKIYDIYDIKTRKEVISHKVDSVDDDIDDADLLSFINAVKNKAKPLSTEPLDKAEFANLKGVLKVKCAVCRSEFFSPKKLLAHKKVAHPMNDDLDEEYNVYAEMAKQQNRTKPKPVYACDICPKKYNYKGAFRYHMRGHSGQKPFVCTDCGKSFADKNYWVRHRRVHTKEKPYLCAECGDSFNFLEGYRTHVRKHTGEKPFKCNYCGEGFIKSCEKTRHVRKVHTGERPFLCKICGMKFMGGNDLKRHLRRHQAKGESID